MAPPRFDGWALASACCYTGTQITGDGTLDRIPQAVVAREDAMRLARTMRLSGKVRVVLIYAKQIGPAIEQEKRHCESRA